MGNEAKDESSKDFSGVNGTGTGHARGLNSCRLYVDNYYLVYSLSFFVLWCFKYLTQCRHKSGQEITNAKYSKGSGRGLH